MKQKARTLTVKELVEALTKVSPEQPHTDDTPVRLEIVVDGKRGVQDAAAVLVGHDHILILSADAFQDGSLDQLPIYATDGKDSGVLQ